MSTFDPPRPARRPFWGDVRFLLGIVLVVASIAGVWLVVSSARQTEPVYAAARTLVPGEALSADDLRIVEVALGQADAAYLTPATLGDAGVLTRTVEEGELLPVSAVGAPALARTTSVVVRSAAEVPAAVDTGAVVEVWAAPVSAPGEFETPRILIPDATVAAVLRDDGVVGSSGPALELVIARADVAALLAAMAGGSALSVVPVAGAAR
ncbi:SAF domain-containing protein [Microbacterium hominis]|uniref:SAF domain-containing protein n=1 Tax=Microbacterium hominis TaxID=162426 RepID=A0A7D4Q8M2_9MICO|nr:SAF domain-containing protein [Microbacterium hominis]QKJ19979.1 hypothetical protein HQM25_11840 [Microbacterium hominis]